MRLEKEPEPLASMSVRGFVELLGSRTPAPGGGSASALMAAMGGDDPTALVGLPLIALTRLLRQAGLEPLG